MRRVPLDKRGKGGLAAAILILAAAILLEIFAFNFHGIAEETYTDTFALDGSDSRVRVGYQQFLAEVDEQTLEDLRYQEEMNRLYYELLGAGYEDQLEDRLVEKDGKTYMTVQQAVIHVSLGEERYIKGMKFAYPVDESRYADYGVEAKFYRDGELLNDYLMYDTVSSRLDEGYMNVGMTADEAEFITYGDFAFEGEGASVSFWNQFSFNGYRAAFLAGSGWLVLFLCMARELYLRKLHVVFGIVCLYLGLSMVILVGSNQSGWDEHIHFLKAYEASFGSTIETPESAMGMRGKYTPGFATAEERSAVTEYLREHDDMETADISYQSRFIGYSTRAYLPQSLFLALARMLHMPFDMQYMMGKAGNLVFYMLVLMLAMGLAKSGRKFIAVLGLMPTPLFLASEYTYDAFITALLFLGFILWLNEIFSDGYLRWQNALLMMACFAAGSWSKQIYIFMIFLLCFLPARKFRDRKSRVFLILGCAAVAGWLLYSIFSAPGAAPTIGVGVDYNLSTAGDRRVQGVSMVGQILYILQNPLTYAKMLLSSMARTLWAYTFGGRAWLDLAYNGLYPTAFGIGTAALLLFACLVRTDGEDRLVLPARYKVLLGVMFAGIAAVIWTSLYGTYSVVGAATIEGVQARYYIPLMLPLLYIFVNNRIKFRWDPVWYYRILFLGVSALNIYGIYEYILRATCF